MALMIKCNKCNTGYVSADLYPAWWIEANIPGCPLCRLEWIEEHKETWDLLVPWEAMEENAHRAMSNCRGLSITGG